MTRRFGFLCVALAAASFAKDAQQPIQRGAVELSFGYAYAMVPGAYDSTGKYQGWGEAVLPGVDTVYRFPKGYLPAVYGVPFRIKYGLGGGFDARLDWSAAFANDDAGGQQGMSQPKLGIKYAARRLGAFANLTLPYATGDWDNGDLLTTAEIGGIVRKRLARFRFTGLLSYVNRLSDPRDDLRASVQPEILWRPGLSTHLGFEGSRTLGRDTYLLQLNPGVRGDFSDALSWDILGNFTIAGRNAPAGWLLRTNLYWVIAR